jgi:hypothetical protein
MKALRDNLGERRAPVASLETLMRFPLVDWAARSSGLTTRIRQKVTVPKSTRTDSRLRGSPAPLATEETLLPKNPCEAFVAEFQS